MGRARSLSQFQREFPNEENCATFLAARRWPDGFVCPGCGSKHGWSLASRARLYECTDCRRQTSITAGTVLHRSKLPLQVWFWAAHLMATHSNGMSALQLAAQLGVDLQDRVAPGAEAAPLDDRSGSHRFLKGGRGRSDRDSVPSRWYAFGKIIVAGAVEVVDRTTNRAKPRKLGAKYLDTRSGRVRLAAIPDNSAASSARFHTGQRPTGSDAAHRRPQLLSGPLRLPPRSTHGRQDGGPRRPAMDSSRLLADETLGPGHLSRTARQASRHVPQRVRLPIQPPLLSARLVRDRAWHRLAQRAGKLLDDHRSGKPAHGGARRVSWATASPRQITRPRST